MFFVLYYKLRNQVNNSLYKNSTDFKIVCLKIKVFNLAQRCEIIFFAQKLQIKFSLLLVYCIFKIYFYRGHSRHCYNLEHETRYSGIYC